MKMKSKIHSKILNRWSIHKIPIQKGKLGDYRLAVRDLNGKWSKSDGEPVFILSNQNSRFKELEEALKEMEGKPIELYFIRKFGKKFINEIS